MPCMFVVKGRIHGEHYVDHTCGLASDSMCGVQNEVHVVFYCAQPSTDALWEELSSLF